MTYELQLKKISLINYKNIRQAEIEFSSGINCFIGLNGSGKTNLLDAVYYLSCCKSHTGSLDSQNITHDEDFFVLQGEYAAGDRHEYIYCGLKRRQKKQFKRNKKEYERLSDHVGILPLVLISPDDSRLLTDGSDERRRFMDSIISQNDRDYLHALINYNTALTQRNSLLKSDSWDTALYEIWEEQLARYGTSIYEKRQAFITDFLPIFSNYYRQLSQDSETVSLAYISQLEKGDLAAQLQTSRERDLILGYTTKGTHRDDLETRLGDFPIKRVGSQGQNKTYLIALKLAQFNFIAQQTGITPILLLDDIFDKLDSLRVRQIIRLVSEKNFGQIFITDTNREHLDKILAQLGQEARIFMVENGEITLNS